MHLFHKGSCGEFTDKVSIPSQVVGSLAQVGHLPLHPSLPPCPQQGLLHPPTGACPPWPIASLTKWLGTYDHPGGRARWSVGKAQLFLCVGCSHCHKYGNTESAEGKTRGLGSSHHASEQKLSMMPTSTKCLPFSLLV